VKQLVIGSGPAGTQLVYGNTESPVPVLIQNIDPLNTLYLGVDSAVNVANPLENAPLAPGQSTVASGCTDVFGIAAPGQNVALALYAGVTSFFQPPSLASIGGAAVYVQATAPVSTPANPIPANSLWFNTTLNTIETWNGSLWVIQPLNAQNMLVAASITAAQVASGTLTSAQLSTAAGILGTQIAAGTIQGNNIAADTIVAANIAANTITSAELAAGIVYAGIVDGTQINGGTFLAGNLPNVQARLTEISGVGILDFPLNATGYSGNPIMDAGIGTGGSGPFAQLAVNGATKTSHPDYVGMEWNSSDSASSANLEGFYNDTGGTGHLVTVIDQNGFSCGFCHGLQAIQPGTSGPTMATEGWHAITMDSGWSVVGGYRQPQYRILPDGNLQLSGLAAYSSNITGIQNLNGSNPLPAAYRPGAEMLFRALSPVGGRCAAQILTTGVIQAVASSTYPSGYLELDAVIRCP
jgi:hypothetical protein